MLLLINKTGFRVKANEILQNNLSISEFLLNHNRNIIIFWFLKCLVERQTNWGGGGDGPQAPMVATALLWINCSELAVVNITDANQSQWYCIVYERGAGRLLPPLGMKAIASNYPRRLNQLLMNVNVYGNSHWAPTHVACIHSSVVQWAAEDDFCFVWRLVEEVESLLHRVISAQVCKTISLESELRLRMAGADTVDSQLTFASGSMLWGMQTGCENILFIPKHCKNKTHWIWI